MFIELVLPGGSETSPCVRETEVDRKLLLVVWKLDFQKMCAGIVALLSRLGYFWGCSVCSEWFCAVWYGIVFLSGLGALCRFSFLTCSGTELRSLGSPGFF